MKKITYLVTMLAFLLGMLTTNAQEPNMKPLKKKKMGNSFYPRVPGRTPAQIRDVFTTPLYVNGEDFTKKVLTEYAESINASLQAEGDTSEDHKISWDMMGWVLDNTLYAKKSDYTDSVITGYRDDEYNIYHSTTCKKDGYYLVFSHWGHEVRYADPECLNSIWEMKKLFIDKTPTTKKPKDEPLASTNPKTTTPKPDPTVPDDCPCNQKKQKPIDPCPCNNNPCENNVLASRLNEYNDWRAQPDKCQNMTGKQYTPTMGCNNCVCTKQPDCGCNNCIQYPSTRNRQTSTPVYVYRQPFGLNVGFVWNNSNSSGNTGGKVSVGGGPVWVPPGGGGPVNVFPVW